jgi:hypothetical protein
MPKAVTVAKNKARVGFLVLKDPPDYCAFYFDPTHAKYGKYQYHCEAFRLTGGNKGIGYFRMTDGYNGWMHGVVPPGMAEQNKNYNFYPDLAAAVANLPASMPDKLTRLSVRHLSGQAWNRGGPALSSTASDRLEQGGLGGSYRGALGHP